MKSYPPTKARLAVLAGASLAVFGASVASASAQFIDLGDAAVANNAPQFRLNAYTLEPGCFKPGTHRMHHGVDFDDQVDVTERGRQARITVDPDANFAIDQVLVGGDRSGYAIYNSFDTGTIANDVDIDPEQTATGLKALDGDDADASTIIVCVSDHPDGDQNEPYVGDKTAGEVAAINRPIIQPTIASMGVSAVSALNTYKVGFGYEVKRGYDSSWRSAFLNDGVFGPGLSFGDPQALDTNGDGFLDHVVIKSRAEQSGVRRYNDMDEAGEAYNQGAEKSSYGQPIAFDVSGNGNPTAYLHKAFPGVVDGGFAPFDSWIEGEADQTAAASLLTFTAEGDLPLTWAVKPSLAPSSYGKKVSLTDDMLRAWNQSWQDYYAGKGPKPTLALAPGTNSPKPDPSITVIVNQPEARPTAAPQAPVAMSTTTTTVTREQVAAAPVKPNAIKTTKTTVRSARLARTRSGAVVKVFVASSQSKVQIRIRMYNAKGGKVGETRKWVSTNRTVSVSGLRIAKQVKSVKASVL